MSYGKKTTLERLKTDSSAIKKDLSEYVSKIGYKRKQDPYQQEMA